MASALELHDGSGVAISTGYGVLLAYGEADSLPANGEPGYAKGCMFIDATNGKWYINAGTKASAGFEEHVSA